MDMGWRILYVDEGEYLSLYIDNIKIKNRKADKEIIIPINDLHTLILDNYKSVLSVQLMNALSKKNVNVVLCGVDHVPQTLIIPHKGNRQAPMMLRRQMRWDNRVKNLIQKEIVTAKIDNQIELLVHLEKDGDAIFKLKSYQKTVEEGDVTNREGLAAKVYFRALFGHDFKRFDEDALNAGLNYGYSILRSQISKTLIAKGLHPALGFFHNGPNNHFNLSDDFIEPFRPLIDHCVHTHLVGEKLFKKEHKLTLIKETTKKILYKNVRQTLFNAVNQYVDAVVNFAESGDLKKLDHPIIDFNAL